jgi:hypothetical protein
VNFDNSKEANWESQMEKEKRMDGWMDDMMEGREMLKNDRMMGTFLKLYIGGVKGHCGEPVEFFGERPKSGLSPWKLGKLPTEVGND